MEQPYKGWVPLLRQNGEQKMIAEREIPADSVPTEAVLAANPALKKSGTGLGATLGRGLTTGLRKAASTIGGGKKTASATE